MKTIKKQILSTAILAAKVMVENGVVVTEDLPVITTTETVTENNAEKVYRKLSGIDKKEKIMILSADKTTLTYSMPLDKFLELATIVNDVDTDNTAAEYKGE